MCDCAESSFSFHLCLIKDRKKIVSVERKNERESSIDKLIIFIICDFSFVLSI